MTSKALQRIRDPLNNLIVFENNLLESVLWRIVQTPTFQRLRRVRQLGFSEFVYPGATHTRLIHSLGVFHTAKHLVKKIDDQLELSNPRRGQVAIAAALLHDVGHGAFSHSFEMIGKQLELKFCSHENVSVELIRSGEISDLLNGYEQGFADQVADMIEGKNPDIYSSVVSSQFDADRLDYLRRDRLMTGTDHGAIDYQWLLENLIVTKVPIGSDENYVTDIDILALNNKAFRAAEGYVLGLFHLYPTVYLHKATRGMEKCFQQLLFEIQKETCNSGLKKVGLGSKHPLVRFFKSPNKIENATALDDTVIWGALSQLQESSNNRIKFLAEAMQNRKMYKCFDLRHELKLRSSITNENDARVNDALLNEACEVAYEEVSELLTKLESQSEGEPPRLLLDKDKRVPYKKVSNSGAQNQINIESAPNGKCVDIREMSEVVRSINEFRLDRVYFQRDDSSIKQTIEQIVEKVGKHGNKV